MAEARHLVEEMANEFGSLERDALVASSAALPAEPMGASDGKGPAVADEPSQQEAEAVGGGRGVEGRRRRRRRSSGLQALIPTLPPVEARHACG